MITTRLNNADVLFSYRATNSYSLVEAIKVESNMDVAVD